MAPSRNKIDPLEKKFLQQLRHRNLTPFEREIEVRDYRFQRDTFSSRHPNH